MTIKSRLKKLEQRQPVSTFKRVALIPVHPGETKEQATERWLAENPGPTPDQIIFLVPLEAA